MHESDSAKRIALYETIQREHREHREHSPFIFLMQNTLPIACRKNISGVNMTVLRDNPYDQVKKA